MTGRTERGDSTWINRSRSDDTVRLPVVEPPTDPGVDAPGVGAPVTTTDAGRDDPAAGAPGGDAERDAGGAASVARNSATMAVGSIVSRITGLLRTAAIAAVLGGYLVGDDYNLANTLPNMVYELLLGGVLASVIVPVLVRARRTEPDRGEAYAQRLLTLAVVFFGAATVVAVLAAPLFTALLASGATGPDQHLITNLAYLLLPEIFFYGLAAIFAAILNTRGHFAAPMWTPILNNIVVIVTAVVFLLLPKIDPTRPQSMTAAHVLVLGIGTTLGIVVQAAGLWPAMRRTGFSWRWRWDLRQLNLRELARLGAWMLLFVVVSQVGVFVVLKIAKMATRDPNAAGPIVFNNGFLIFMMAHGIVAVSIITALLPRMSAAAAAGRYTELAAQLSLGTRLAAVVLVPIAVAYVVLGRPLAVTLFQRGNYHHPSAVATGSVIAVAGLALIPYTISQLQIFAFYALSDTRTPALINIPVVALRLGIDIVIWFVVAKTAVVSGLMAGSAVSFVAGTVMGYWLLRRKIGALGLVAVARSLVRLVLAGAAASLPAAAVAWAVGKLLGAGWTASVVQLTIGGAALLASYVAAALLLGVPEIRQVGSMVSGRLNRTS